MEATDSQSTSYRPDLADGSEAKHGKSSPYPASTVSGDCRPGTYATRSSRSSKLQSASIDHLYRYHRFYGKCKRDHEGIGGLEFCVEQSCPLEDKGSDWRRRPLHYYHLCVRPVPRSVQENAYDRPSDMYIADLTDVVVKKKHLPGFSSDWVLCLGDLSLALPLDRTVASLESTTDLALVKRQFAVEHGLRIGDRRGGDPSSKSPLPTFDL